MKFEQLHQHLFEQIHAADMSKIKGGAEMATSLGDVFETNVQTPGDPFMSMGSVLDVRDID